MIVKMKRFIFIDYKVFVIVFLSAITCACDNPCRMIKIT